MNYLEWHVGMKVVCVGCEGTPKPLGYWEKWQRGWGVTKPSRGEVYTIRSIDVCKGVVFIRLVELVNPIAQYVEGPMEPWWPAKGFRPVEPRKTDISVFTAMLTGAKERERA